MSHCSRKKIKWKEDWRPGYDGQSESIYYVRLQTGSSTTHATTVDLYTRRRSFVCSTWTQTSNLMGGRNRWRCLRRQNMNLSRREREWTRDLFLYRFSLLLFWKFEKCVGLSRQTQPCFHQKSKYMAFWRHRQVAGRAGSLFPPVLTVSIYVRRIVFSLREFLSLFVVRVGQEDFLVAQMKVSAPNTAFLLVRVALP